MPNYFPSDINDLTELKRLYRLLLKDLHPDCGGDKEEFLRFLAWYREHHRRLKGFKVEITKGLPPTGNYIYRCEEFTLEELLVSRKKTLLLPVERRCPKCEGKIFDQTKRSICGNCGGSGFVEVTPSMPQRTEEKVYIVCPFCRGKGRVQKHLCSTCSGKGIVREELKIVFDLPLGLEEGDYLLLNKDKFNLPQNVYIEVIIKEHPIFKREGKNLVYELHLDIWDLLLLDYMEVPTLEGSEEIPTSILRETQELVLRGRGLYHLDADGGLKRGDLIVKLKIDLPKTIPLEVKRHLSRAYETYKVLFKGGAKQ